MNKASSAFGSVFGNCHPHDYSTYLKNKKNCNTKIYKYSLYQQNKNKMPINLITQLNYTDIVVISKITNKCENAISIDYTKYPFYNYYLIDPKGVLLSGKNSCYIEPYITCSNTNYTNYLEPLQPININTTNYYV